MKHHSTPTRLLLLFSAVAFAWASCQQPAATTATVVSDSSYKRQCDTAAYKKHVIPDSVAQVYQNRFLAAYASLKTQVPDTFIARHFRIPNAETFSKEAFCAMVNYPGVDSIRFFYGEDSTGGFALVVKGVGLDGKVLTTHFLNSTNAGVSDKRKSSTNTVTDGGDALENGQTCPPCLVTP